MVWGRDHDDNEFLVMDDCNGTYVILSQERMEVSWPDGHLRGPEWNAYWDAHTQTVRPHSVAARVERAICR